MSRVQILLIILSLGTIGIIASAEAIRIPSINDSAITAITLFLSIFFTMICAGWVKKARK